MFISAYLGFSPPTEVSSTNDKALHFVIFFLLTVSPSLFSSSRLRFLTDLQLSLYWALDLPRRVLLKIILLASLGLSVVSEVVQGLLPNERLFDPFDIAANVLGSMAALALCAWYHRRMLERKRRRKLQGYGIVADGDGEEDIELGEGGGGGQELGIVAEEEEDDGGEAWDNMDGDDQVKVNGNAEGSKDDPQE